MKIGFGGFTPWNIGVKQTIQYLGCEVLWCVPMNEGRNVKDKVIGSPVDLLVLRRDWPWTPGIVDWLSTQANRPPHIVAEEAERVLALALL